MPKHILGAVFGAVTLCTIALLSGCSLVSSDQDFGESWTGQPIESLKRQWGAPSGETSNADGGSDVRYEIPKWGCTYWFTSDASGKIVRYRYKVEPFGTCKPVG